MAEIPDDYLDLVDASKVGSLATVRPDGTPHQTVTRVDFDGEHILVNTVETHRKVANVRAHPHAGVCVVDPENIGRYLSVAGPATVTAEGAEAHAAEHGFGAHGGDDITRVLLRIEPAHVIAH